MCRQKWKQTTGRVGVVVITIASHAIGRGFNPRIRYFSFLSIHFKSVLTPFIYHASPSVQQRNRYNNS